METGTTGTAATEVTVRELATREECALVDPLLESVWGPGTPPIGLEVLRVLAHEDCYVAGAFVGTTMVGASVGFLAHRGQSLHSHITGVTRDAQGRGVGRAVKEHQRAWALARGIGTITWTCDPLVRRNAWFNLVKLGALPGEYLVDFYGPMSDELNRADESDRLYMSWALHGPPPSPYDAGAAEPVLALVGDRAEVRRSSAPMVLVATPHDIERLRQRDPGLARAWRLAMREALSSEMSRGRVVGLTESGEYVVRRHPGSDQG